MGKWLIFLYLFKIITHKLINENTCISNNLFRLIQKINQALPTNTAWVLSYRLNQK